MEMLLHPPRTSTVSKEAAGRLRGRADLHAHTYYSDGSDGPAALVEEARRRRLDVLAVTDHDTIDGALRAAELVGRPGRGEGPEVIVGEEVSSRDGHILGLFLTHRVAPHQPAAATVEAIHAQGGLAIAAHPFWHAEGYRRRQGVGGLIGSVAFDAVEVRNGGVTPSMVQANHRASVAAAALELVPVGGSDAHVKEALGLAATAFSGRTAADLGASLLHGLVAPLGRPPDPRALFSYLSWAIERPVAAVTVPETV